MMFKTIKVIAKTALIAFGVWLALSLVVSVFACLPQKKVSDSKKTELAGMQYYGTGATGPDRALVIETPTDALNIRMEMVRGAENTLDIANHVIKDSESTRAFLGEVVAAADRGVQVRLLVDGKSFMAGGTIKKLLKAMDAHPNIACRRYNPVHPLKPWNLQALLHDKFIIADNKLLLLGGRNFDQRHFDPSGFQGAVTHDRDVFVWRKSEGTQENPSAAVQTTAYMELLWGYELTKPLSSRPMRADEAAPYLNTLQSSLQNLHKTDPHFFTKQLHQYIDDTLETSRITLLYNPVEATAKEPWVGWQLAQLMLAAEQSVVLQTPYATGNKLFLSTLAQAAERAPVTMLTNSPASTPNYPAFSNYCGQRKKFILTGISIYEYQNADSIHGKSMVVDSRLSAVGSFNMDDRSCYLDTETMLVIDSPAFAAQLEGVIADIQGQSLLVGQDNTYQAAGGVQPLRLKPAKAVLIWLSCVLLRPLQFLL